MPVAVSGLAGTVMRRRIEDERDVESVRLFDERRHFAQKVEIRLGRHRLHFRTVGSLASQDVVEVEAELGHESAWRRKRRRKARE